MDGCRFVGIKVGRHLQTSHLMKAVDDNYKDALKAAPFHNKSIARSEIQDVRKQAAKERTLESQLNILEEMREVEAEEEPTNLRNNVDDTMRMFLRYLTSAEGKFRDEKSAHQTVQEVKTVVCHLGGLIENLFNKTKVCINLL